MQPGNPETYPTGIWHMSPWTLLDIQNIIMNAGYGNGDTAALEISHKYGKPIYTKYTIRVHYDWA